MLKTVADICVATSFVCILIAFVAVEVQHIRTVRKVKKGEAWLRAILKQGKEL